MKKNTRTQKSKKIIIFTVELFAIFLLFVSVWLFDRYVCDSEEVPALTIRFFDSGDTCTALILCNGKVAVIGDPHSVSDDLTSSLESRNVGSVDLIVSPKGDAVKGIEKYVRGDTDVRVLEGGTTKIKFADGTVDIDLFHSEKGSFYGILEHANQTFLLGLCVSDAREYLSLIGEDTVFTLLSALEINDSDIEAVKKAPSVGHCVICDKKDRSAGDSVATDLWGSGVKYIRTKDGNVSVLSDGRDIYLLPDISCVE